MASAAKKKLVVCGGNGFLGTDAPNLSFFALCRAAIALTLA
jgi:hypothetical protein